MSEKPPVYGGPYGPGPIPGVPASHVAKLEARVAEVEKLRDEIEKKDPTRTGGEGGKAPRMPNTWFFYAAHIANDAVNTHPVLKPADLARKIQSGWRSGWPKLPTPRKLETFASQFLEVRKIISEA
jgi:hypothetical protein